MRDFVINALVLVTCFTAIFATVAMAAPSANDNESGVAIVRKLSDDEAAAFLRRDAGALSGMWSDELVVTNPLNNVVTKQQVLEMVRSGFLVITSYSRKVEYEEKIWRHRDTDWSGGSRLGRQNAECRQVRKAPVHGSVEKRRRYVAGNCAARKHHSHSIAIASRRGSRLVDYSESSPRCLRCHDFLMQVFAFPEKSDGAPNQSAILNPLRYREPDYLHCSLTIFRSSREWK